MNNFLMRQQTATFSNAVKSILGRTCIVDFGIVKKVYMKDDAFLGVVQVLMSASTDSSDIRIMDCTLLNVSSKALMINAIPSEGDKVLVLFPRRFNEDMFSIENTETIVDTNNAGYTPFSGIAILANQFRKSDYLNTLTIDKGALQLNLAYSEEDKGNLLNIVTGKDGSVSVTSNKGDNLQYSIQANANGVIIQDKNKNKITTSSSGIELKALDSYTASFTDSQAVIGALTIKKG